MAAPVASGSGARQPPAASEGTTPVVSSMATPATTTAPSGTVRAAANPTQRSCRRSTPLARRRRTTSDHAPTTSPAVAWARPTAMAASTGPASAGAVTGSMMVSYGGITSPGPTARANRKAAGATADSLAHQRQRGEGGDPVGVRSRIQPTQTNPRYRVAGL